MKDTVKELKNCSPIKCVLGCDPELAFKKNGYIIGAEKFLPENLHKVVMDGVMVELQPTQSSCREGVAGNLRAGIEALRMALADKKIVPEHTKCSVPISKKHMSELSDSAKEWGCNPSMDVYTGEENVMTENPETYLHRHAGGHIHLGRYVSFNGSLDVAIDNPKNLIKVMDIVLGNTCVLLDQDEGNIERRKHYGRAGEYRVQPHGLEYRTLSNFWLRSTELVSLVLGLARYSAGVVESGQHGKLFKLVDINDIRKAINTNDKALALSNFKKIQSFIRKTSYNPNNSDETRSNGYCGFHPLGSKRSQRVLLQLSEDGLDKYFGSDLFKYWAVALQRNGWKHFSDREEFNQ